MVQALFKTSADMNFADELRTYVIIMPHIQQIKIIVKYKKREYIAR